ncbi:hypothetical protein QTP88_014961 [Uroleucon formosanum]
MRTTDIEGRFVCNVVIGLLHDEYYSEPWLLMSEELFKCNFQTVDKLFNDAMQLLWPSGIKYENVLLFVADAAPYMVKAADSLTVLFLIHLTCLAHGIHRVFIIKLQNKSLTLHESLQIIINARDRLLECNGRVADKVKNKLSLILQKNKGFKTLQSINNLLNGESNEDNFSCNLTPGQISNKPFKFSDLKYRRPDVLWGGFPVYYITTYLLRCNAARTAWALGKLNIAISQTV